MIGKAAPRSEAGTRQQSTLHHTRLIARLAPSPEFADEYAVIAAILLHPDLVANHLRRLSPSLWQRQPLRIIVRVALPQLRAWGRADFHQIKRLIVDAGACSRVELEIEIRTIVSMADVVWRCPGLVDAAIRGLFRDARGAA